VLAPHYGDETDDVHVERTNYVTVALSMHAPLRCSRKLSYQERRRDGRITKSIRLPSARVHGLLTARVNALTLLAEHQEGRLSGPLFRFGGRTRSNLE